MTGARERPRQAVILAGGRGVRLLPLTRTRPKPMIEFHGRPFLEYLVEMLAAQGFERIVLLLGYLPDVIRDHFGDGSRWGVSIEYSVSGVEEDTGLRVRRALPLLDTHFLLLYCDNYWPMRFDDMWSQYRDSGRRALVTVYDNEDGYTRSNMTIDRDGVVTRYDRSRTEPDLAGVDIGFIILERGIVESLPLEDFSLESVVYPALIERRELVAYRTGHRYYSVGTHERLEATGRFLAREPTVLLDRDGVLNRRMPRACYVESWSDWEWMPGALASLVRLTKAGYRIIVITNQPGIARGKMTAAALHEIHGRMCADAGDAGARIDRVYHCPHGWDDGCGCRKPGPGMFFEAQREHDLDLSRTFYLGDEDRDAEAAAAAGCPFIRVGEDLPIDRAVDAVVNG